jgi:hypothetical protein
VAESLDDLKRLVPPPADPQESEGDWETIEAELGKNLPQDYKAFIHSYGTGSFIGFINVSNPFSANRNVNLLDKNRRVRKVMQESVGEDKKTGYLRENRFELFLEPDNMLLWGGTDNGDYLLWRTRGMESQWSVIACNWRNDDFEEYPGENVVSFPAGVVTGRIRCGFFPDDLKDDRPQFFRHDNPQLYLI